MPPPREGDGHGGATAGRVGLVALTLAIDYLLPRLTTAVLSALVAILVGTGLSIRLGLDIPTKVAKVIEVSSELLAPDHRIYRVRGQLFFVNSICFRQGFEPHEHPHPARVPIDMGDAHIWYQSGVSALDQVIRRLKLGGSRVEVVHLNPESTDLFARIGVAAEAGGSGRSTASAH